VKPVVSHQLARNPVVSTRVTASTRLPPVEGKHGNVTILKATGDTVRVWVLRLWLGLSLSSFHVALGQNQTEVFHRASYGRKRRWINMLARNAIIQCLFCTTALNVTTL
jgi:hypothetical protein